MLFNLNISFAILELEVIKYNISSVIDSAPPK